MTFYCGANPAEARCKVQCEHCRATELKTKEPSAKYRARYIQVDGTIIEELTSRPPTYERMRKFIDGSLERFSLKVVSGGGKVVAATMWVDEEGQLKSLPVNKVATDLAAEGAALMHTTLRQHLVGPVVLVNREAA